jgi:palmitoyl transferase
MTLRHAGFAAALYVLTNCAALAQSTAGAPSLKLDPSLNTQATTSPAPSTPGLVARTTNLFEKIWKEGRDDIYVTGYAYHDPQTYTAEKRATLNNNAWGGGYGRTITSDRGNTHSLYAMAFLDSHENVQPNIGYAYQAVWGNTIKVGAGATVLIASRPDIFHGAPFPAVLPLLSIGTEKANLMFVPIPKLSNSQNANNGNVLFIFGRFAYQ